jgi:hypothetical protein
MDRREVGWNPDPVWTILRTENSWPYRDSNSDPSVVEPVASCYTDCAIPALNKTDFILNVPNVQLSALLFSIQFGNEKESFEGCSLGKIVNRK